jgi:serine/threonine protein kinase
MGQHRPPEEWIGEVIDNKYRIKGILGVGGMGMVFRAKRVMVGDEVALKILFPRLLRSALQRRLFQDEAIASARLSHPHVVTVYDADLAGDDTAYIAMELLHGHTLKDLMKAEAPMEPLRLLAVAMQICDGLSAAHKARIVHRDLKPDNIFLEARDTWPPRIKLVDFGIAAMVDADRNDENERLLGTLRYMSPEQCRGDALDGRADLYSLGVLLYEGLTRRRATGKTLAAVLRDEIKPPNTVLPEGKALPHSLENLVMRLLAKRAEDRPANAREVQATLTAIIDELTAGSAPVAPVAVAPLEPLTPPEAGPSWRLWLGLLLAGIAGVSAGVLWEYFRQ